MGSVLRFNEKGKSKLMRADKLVEGIQIILKYWPDAEVEPQHDLIYVGGDKIDPPTSTMAPEDRQRLEKLGWAVDEQFDCWYR